jgi:hypothetical protein
VGADLTFSDDHRRLSSPYGGREHGGGSTAKWTAIEERVVENYARDGYSVPAIAEAVKRSPSAIRNLLERKGIEPMRVEKSGPGLRTRRIDRSPLSLYQAITFDNYVRNMRRALDNLMQHRSSHGSLLPWQQMYEDVGQEQWDEWRRELRACRQEIASLTRAMVRWEEAHEGKRSGANFRLSYRCRDCDVTGNAGTLFRHLRASGHSGRDPV